MKMGSRLRACLHEGGGPQVGEVTWGGLPHLTCKLDHIQMRNYMDRRVTPPKRVTSSIWCTPPPCKQALIDLISKKANCTCSTLFLLISEKQICTYNTLFCLFLAVVLHDYNAVLYDYDVKLPSYTLF